ncbi:hypothetical protein CSC73_10515 [Pseudoxanthomonas sacheonensis]|nr:hypothetical protein CSC73_10515 [Pseudoxanthomonas sacheonensis]
MALSLRCECGRVQGRVETDQVYVRATCYCKDCQAYARWLDRPGVADAQGGTDMVAMNPAAVHITAGSEQIACMSLSGKGYCAGTRPVAVRRWAIRRAMAGLLMWGLWLWVCGRPGRWMRRLGLRGRR